jgi:hypothetical protein
MTWDIMQRRGIKTNSKINPRWRRRTMAKVKKYTITITETDDGRTHMNRLSDGFTPLELLGAIELTRSEIIDQLHGKFKPDTVTRRVVEEEDGLR